MLLNESIVLRVPWEVFTVCRGGSVRASWLPGLTASRHHCPVHCHAGTKRSHCDLAMINANLSEKSEEMALFRIRPTSIDRRVAQRIVATARPVPEGIERALTWGADEHLLLGCAAAAWTAAVAFRSPLRPATGHLLIVVAATAALPHVLKTMFDQVRPDRTTVKGHLYGIPISGHSTDAFPSGHAVHMGALASAATVLPLRYKIPAWCVALGLSATRVAILAHWVSDVVAGFAIGIAVERTVRRFTGYPDIVQREGIANGQAT